MSNSVTDKNLQKFADLMIKKIQEASSDWKKPWFTTVGHGLPQNVDGRIYNGMNSFMLYLHCDEMKYKTPVFMTFAQAKEKGVNVLRGEKSFPVVYWNFSIKDNHGNKITLDEYKSLSKDQQEEYTVSPYMKYYLVFNLDQTNFPEVHPEKWEAIQQKFNVTELKDDKGMFSCPQIDMMLEHNSWLCPIVSEKIDQAFYRPSEDKIFVPLKGQFYTGEGFYSTLIHEMAHSTGVESRLGRELKNKFGSPKYAKEELVAELTSAVTCQALGIVSGIQEENAQYLKNWLGAISEEPKFIYSVLADVGKAATMILNEVCPELAVSVPSKAIPVMTEEQYLTSKGYSNHFGDPALHKGMQKSQRLQDKIVDRQLEKDRECSSKRNELRKEYQEKLSSGALREPTSVERLIKVANGMPELESVQAARRALEKRGVSWNKEDVPKDQSSKSPKDITSAFSIAIVAGLSGHFQGLVDLKQNGYAPSENDLKLLQDIAPSVRPAVESIFHIKIDPLQFVELKGTVTQLSLNF